jgi:hypothetical protein
MLTPSMAVVMYRVRDFLSLLYRNVFDGGTYGFIFCSGCEVAGSAAVTIQRRADSCAAATSAMVGSAAHPRPERQHSERDCEIVLGVGPALPTHLHEDPPPEQGPTLKPAESMRDNVPICSEPDSENKS